MLRSRTMIFGALLAALGVIQASTDVFTQFLSPTAMGVLTTIVGVAVAVLRVLTTTPVGCSQVLPSQPTNDSTTEGK
jgi:hypothetical protein